MYFLAVRWNQRQNSSLWISGDNSLFLLDRFGLLNTLRAPFGEQTDKCASALAPAPLNSFDLHGLLPPHAVSFFGTHTRSFAASRFWAYIPGSIYSVGPTG